MNLCSPCGLDFATVPDFDSHRVGVHAYTYHEGLKFDPPVEDGRRCLTLDEMKAAGWTQNSHGRWRRKQRSMPVAVSLSLSNAKKRKTREEV